jgi:hypothetical protein
MTCCRASRAIQVARTHASRLRWVSSSASTTDPAGSWAMAWRRVARIWSRSGSPRATRRGRRLLATSRTRRCRVRWLIAGRPSRCHSRGIVQARGVASSRRMRWASLGLPSRGRAAAGPAGKAADAVLLVAPDPAANGARVVAEQLGDLGGVEAACRQQDHDQPGRDPPAAVQGSQQVGVGIGRDGGVDAGRAQNWYQPRVVAVEGDPRGYFVSRRPSARVTDTTSGHPLSAARLRGKPPAWTLGPRSSLPTARGHQRVSCLTKCTWIVRFRQATR